MHPPGLGIETAGAAEARPVDGAIDIGAFEFFTTIFSGDIDGDADVDGVDLAAYVAGGNFIQLSNFAGEFGTSE